MQERLESLLLRVSKSPAIDAGDLDAAFRLVLATAAEGLDVARTSVWFLEQGDAAMRCYLLCDRSAGEESVDLVLTAADFPNYFAALRNERAIIAHDAQYDGQTDEFRETYLKPLGITSMLDAPIRHHGNMIGIMCCEHIGPLRQWNDDETSFVAVLADLIGRAINARESAQAQHELEALNRELERRISARTVELSRANEGLQSASAQLVQSEKMAALGSLVAGVAHEVNTPLGVSISAVSHLEECLKQLLKRFDQGELTERDFQRFVEDAKNVISMLNRNLDRAVHLVQNFKQTAVDQSADNQHLFNLRTTVESVVSSLHPETKKVPVTVVVDIPPDLLVDSYPGSLAQILTNFIINSVRHAFDKEHWQAQTPAQIRLCAELKGSEVEFTYQDNGQGISEDNLGKIFEPFFTTRRGRGGSGLGLSISYTLATQRLGGSIAVSSQLGHGVRFTLHFPQRLPH